MANGEIMKEMDLENYNIQMEKHLLVSLKIIILKMGNLFIMIIQNMKEILKII